VREGDQGYVREFEDGTLKITYGPMPSDALGPFADECREKLQETMEKLLR
jgi:hypothetical protein